ncbi:MAG: DUF5372 family protein, partial [Desulfobulbaceae bacterium]|nr:DUF5372 family protein [Desulfobulbaceae bacterium]
KKYRTTTPDAAGTKVTFQITHPFHPLSGQHYDKISSRWSWGQEWVSFHNDNGRLTSVPVSWTSLCSPDPFVVVSKGRAKFKPNDLMRLVDLIDIIKEAGQNQISKKTLRRG